MTSPTRPAADLLTFVLVALGVPTLSTTETGVGPGRTELWQMYAVESDKPLLITLSGGDVRYRIDRVSVSASGEVDVLLLRQRTRGGDYARRVGMYLGAKDFAHFVDGGRDFLAAVAAKLSTGAEVDRVAGPGGIAGLREQRRNPTTGHRVTLLDGRAAGLDVSDGRWVASCDEHGSLLNCTTLRRASLALAEVLDWCEDCRREVADAAAAEILAAYGGLERAGRCARCNHDVNVAEVAELCPRAGDVAAPHLLVDEQATAAAVYAEAHAENAHRDAVAAAPARECFHSPGIPCEQAPRSHAPVGDGRSSWVALDAATGGPFDLAAFLTDGRVSA